MIKKTTFPFIERHRFAADYRFKNFARKHTTGQRMIISHNEIFTHFMTFIFSSLLIVFSATLLSAQDNADSSHSDNRHQEYRIEKPGTITFTVGVKIKGKVEKPQVMIFLPKERSIYKDNHLFRSFSAEINEPLPFSPYVE